MAVTTCVVPVAGSAERMSVIIMSSAIRAFCWTSTRAAPVR